MIPEVPPIIVGIDGSERSLDALALAARLAGADNQLATIGCGVDGSPESEEALAWAAALARRRDARLQALAVPSRVAFGALSTTGALGYRSADDALRDELEQRMRAVTQPDAAGVRSRDARRAV